MGGGTPFVDREGRYRLVIPSGFIQVRSDAGEAAFARPAGDVPRLFEISVQVPPNQVDLDMVARMQAQEVGKIAPFQLDPVVVASTPACALTFDFTPAGGPLLRHRRVVVVRPDGRMIFLLTAHAPRELFERYGSEFAAFFESFHMGIGQ